MKINRFLLVGLIVAILGILIAGFASPIFAHGLDDGRAALSHGEIWEEMQQDCEDGDYQAMGAGHAGYHGAEDMMGTMGGMY